MEKQQKKYGHDAFFNRELSWLEFNARVLDEAGDRGNPVLDRMKFLSIFSSNLDEFFMIRVAGIRQLLRSGKRMVDDSGLSPQAVLNGIRRRLLGLIRRQYRYYNKELLPELREKGVNLCIDAELSEALRIQAETIFLKQVFPVLTPLAVGPSHPFPVINNGAIEILVKLKEYLTHKTVYAFVEVPEVLPRFIPVAAGGQNAILLTEDLIMAHLGHLFAGCEILDSLPFRLTRDMDFSIDEEGVADLLQSIKKELLQRKDRDPIRLELPAGIRSPLIPWLMQNFKLDTDFKYTVPGPLHLARFMELVGLIKNPALVEEPWPALAAPGLDDKVSMFKAIDRQDIIPLYLPFQSFNPVVRLLEEAAEDPDVLAIKQTLYRVGGDSPVVKALQRAAENGKQVTVIVELKARFDEGNNIVWARRLDESGAHVVYGIAGLKIHGKAMLIIRRSKGVIRRYCHLATGNYNDKTARLYTDIGIFSNDETLCGDVAALFNVMTGYAAPMANWAKLAVSPFDLRRKFLELIDREARLSTPHMPGRIIAKMNALVDSEIITHLYEAAAAGVEIDLIVRGICCLNPGVAKGKIRVISIVDRYLEHSRIFYFANGGNDEYYMSSADWMPRNLDRRIEILFPVEDERIREQLKQLLKAEREDTRKGRRLLDNGSYTRTCNRTDDRNRSQKRIYDDLDRWNEAIAAADSKKLMIFKKKKHTKKTDVHPGSGSLTGGRSVQKG